MSYHAYHMGSDLMIKRENIPFVLDGIRSFDGKSFDDLISECPVNDDCETLIKWFDREYGYVFHKDDDGNIDDIVSENAILIADSEDVFKKIAPYVERGSYITMCGEYDDYWWRWYFDGHDCIEYEGVMTFPGMPPDRSELAKNEDHLCDDDIDDVCPENLRKILYKHE